MSPSLAILAEKTAAIERHLRRLSERMPASDEDWQPMTDASDAVILHLWQAVQIAIDLAVAACVQLGLGPPASYGEAFRKLADQGVLDRELSGRLVRAAGFRNVVAHAYEGLDMKRVFAAATQAPGDLLAFLGALARALGPSGTK